MAFPTSAVDPTPIAHQHENGAGLPTHWGNWQYRSSTRELVYTGTHTYAIELDRCSTSAQVLDWIVQVDSKSSTTAEDVGHLVRALCSLIAPQSNFCPGGIERGPINVSEVLRRR